MSDCQFYRCVFCEKCILRVMFLLYFESTLLCVISLGVSKSFYGIAYISFFVRLEVIQLSDDMLLNLTVLRKNAKTTDGWKLDMNLLSV